MDSTDDDALGYPPQILAYRRLPVKKQQVLFHLMKAGDNFDRPRNVDFFIVVKTAEDAHRAVTFLRDDGFDVYPPSEADGLWDVRGVLNTDVSPINLESALILVNAVALKVGGEFDGWGCEPQISPNAWSRFMRWFVPRRN